MSDLTRPLLIKSGRILDIASNMDNPPKQDLLVRNGRIEAIGGSASAEGGRSDVDVIDAEGHLVIPGLVNAHYHSHDTLHRGMFEQLPLDAWMLYTNPAHYPRLSSELIQTRTALGASECLLNGITTIQDMVSIVGSDQDHVEEIVQSYEQIGIRAVLALQLSDRAACDCVAYWDSLPERTLRCLPAASDPDEQIRFVERTLEIKSELVTWGLGPSAPQRCSKELLKGFTRLSRERGLQVFTHTYESRAQAVLARLKFPEKSLIQHLADVGLLGPRLSIAHGVWISRSEITRLGDHGANLVCNPTSNLKLLNGFAPVLDYADAKINIGLGCDNCSGNDAQNPFEEMKTFALMWGMYAGVSGSGAAKEAFTAATAGSARAIGLGVQVGRLLPGYRADIVLIDLSQPNYRPMNSAVRQLVYAETVRRITKLIVEGKVVENNGTVLSPASHDLKARAEHAKDQLATSIDDLRHKNSPIISDILEAYERANRFPLDFDRFLLRRQ